ncbi:HAD-like domain-containing protein [Phakopsora pachyrhizi]|uniref:Mitochondrial import inner membrane translocase subunit TIM50 n=1 Tax=Phakopsora pachyrhizi TaxID=170000 RepID=A0AAV0BIX6_PHAPC|nr:HAD-like domain-containing protein [Phakopsora pachyrhizi]
MKTPGWNLILKQQQHQRLPQIPSNQLHHFSSSTLSNSTRPTGRGAVSQPRKHSELNRDDKYPSVVDDRIQTSHQKPRLSELSDTEKFDRDASETSSKTDNSLPTKKLSTSFASQMLDLASDLPPPPPAEDISDESSRQNSRRRRLAFRLFGSLFLVVSSSWIWGLTREWDDEEERRRLGQGDDCDRLTRLRARLYDLSDYFNKPAWTPILPPPLPEPHGRPYTLLLDLEDLLVHSSWDREHGWRMAKRPGVDYFLSYLSQLYEIVIFTTQPAYIAAPVCEKLDPYGYYAPYKIFRECCLSRGLIKPQLIKDLDYLGRDLKKVVYLETNPEVVQLQPYNGFILPKWTGKPDDTGLVDLIPLLEAIVFNGVIDVRSVCKAYEGRDPIKAYAESEARQKKELLDKWEKERERRKSTWNIDLRSMFGLSSHDPEEPPKLLVEKDRARAQQAYLEERKYFKENEPTFKKLLEEDRERQMAEMKGTLLGFLSGQYEVPSLFKGENEKKRD